MSLLIARRGSIAASRVTSVPFSGLAVAQLAQAVTSSDSSSYATPSVTPTANALVCVWAMSTTQAITSVTGNGITYTEAVAYGTNFKLALWVGSSASPSAGAITIGLAGTTSGFGYRVEEWTATATPAVRQTKGDTATSGTPSVTLDNSPQASSATAMMLARQAAAGVTPGSDFTETLDLGITSPTRSFFHEYDIGPVDGVCDCSASSILWEAVAAEIGAP